MNCRSVYIFVGVVFQMGQAFGPSEETKVYSSVGGHAVLPCSGAKLSGSCAEVNWAKLWMSAVPEPVVFSGRVVTPSKRSSVLTLGADCSLHIDNLDKEAGGTYVCEHGAGNTTVSLQLLSISVDPSTVLSVDPRISLHCYLSVFIGLVRCDHSGVKLTWVTEKGTELRGGRYSITNKSACHTILSVALRATDHQRKWRCQLTEQQEVKTTVSHTTALADAVEEIFASEGQALTLPCTNPASLSAGQKLQWSLSETPLFNLTAEGKVIVLVNGSTPGLRMNPDSSLSIDGMTEKLSGLYWCSKLNNSARISVHGMVVLHLLKLSRDSVNNTKANSTNSSYSWTCSLTCVDSCEDFNLTWSVSSAGSQQGGDVKQINKTLLSKLILPEHHTPEKIACIALNEGTERARQEWTFQSGKGNQVLTAVGLLLLSLIVLISAIGVVLHVKSRQETCPGIRVNSKSRESLLSFQPSASTRRNETTFIRDHGATQQKSRWQGSDEFVRGVCGLIHIAGGFAEAPCGANVFVAQPARLCIKLSVSRSTSHSNTALGDHMCVSFK